MPKTVRRRSRSKSKVRRKKSKGRKARPYKVDKASRARCNIDRTYYRIEEPCMRGPFQM